MRFILSAFPSHFLSILSFFLISGESGLVYKGYLNTTLGKELVAIKTGKGDDQMFAFHSLLSSANSASLG